MPSPYALYAPSAGMAGSASNILGVLTASQLSGTYSNALTLSHPANGFTGNGGGLTNVNAAALGGLAPSSLWQLGGNAGTTAGQFLGTTDTNALELKVHSERAFRLEPSPVASSGPSLSGQEGPNVIGGYHGNSADAGLVGQRSPAAAAFSGIMIHFCTRR